MHHDLGLKYVYNSFFRSKDCSFCLDILFFWGEISGHFTKTSRHDFVCTVLLNTVNVLTFMSKDLK